MLAAVFTGREIIVDISQFRHHIDAARSSLNSVSSDPRSDFMNELQAAGFEVPRILPLSKLIRIDDPQDKNNEKSGWCIFHEFPDQYNAGQVFAIGIYGSWHGHPEKIVWKSKSDHAMSTQERMQYHDAIERARAQQETEKRIVQAEAAISARAIWSSAESAENHPYLLRKKVKAYDGIRCINGNIIIPLYYGNELVSLEYVAPDGQKWVHPKGRVQGCFFVIQGTQDTVYVGEGYSTCASVAEATGVTVYVARNAGNLYEVTQAVQNMHPHGQIVIIGDDDVFKETNAGRTKANQVSESLKVEVRFPVFKDLSTKPSDFNDLMVLEGIETVRLQLAEKPKLYKPKYAPANEVELLAPVGVLREISNYYSATSGNRQPLFAIQTALAVASVICGRYFETNLGNRTSLFFINIAKSGTGKEHAKKTVDRILEECGEGKIVTGDGYTSDSAVLSALLTKPRHITIIDEFSKYLQASQNKNANGQLATANVKLMESFGRLDGILRPKSYSTMVLTKEKKRELDNLIVINPAITLMAMATPDDLFKTLDISSIKDGFVNRFIICVSDVEREMREHKEKVDVPCSIKDWATKIIERRNVLTEDALMVPPINVVNFSDEALEEQKVFQKYCIDQANALEKYGMDALPGRCNEISMRISLICALAENPLATVIKKEHMAWAIAWVKHNFTTLSDRLKMTLSSSDFEGWKKECLQALRAAGERGVSVSEMKKVQPFAKYREKDLNEILKALVEAELSVIGNRVTGTRGRPTQVYLAIE